MRLSLRVLTLLLVGAALLPSQRIYIETDAVATQCSEAEAVSCSGGAAGFKVDSSLVDETGTAGSTGDLLAIQTNDQRVLYWFESDAVNDTSWASGDWVVRINITSTDPQGEWDHTHICRVSADCSSVLATVGSLLNQNTSVSTSGVKTHTVSGAAQTAGATDLFLVVLTFQDTDTMGNMNVNITPDQNIDTPLDAPIAGANFHRRRVISIND